MTDVWWCDEEGNTLVVRSTKMLKA